MPRHLSRGNTVPSPWPWPPGEWAGHTERACSNDELWRDSSMNGASIPFAQIDRLLTGRIGRRPGEVTAGRIGVSDS